MPALRLVEPARRRPRVMLVSVLIAVGLAGASLAGATRTAGESPSRASGELVDPTWPTSVPGPVDSTAVATAPLPELDWSYEVATAAAGVGEIPVSRTAPDVTQLDVRVSERAAAWSAAQLPPRSATAAGLSPLPTVGRNIAGRIGVDGGWLFTNPTPFKSPPVFLVEENHGAWLKVQVPARPNGESGWVESRLVTLDRRTTRIVVEVGAARLTVLDGDTAMFSTPVVVGAAASPTPTGRLYVTHHEAKSNAAGAYGPWVLGLSGYSETLETFSGGAPGLALHGTNHPELAGQHRSNGCVRVPNNYLVLIEQLAPPGTVVDLVP